MSSSQTKREIVYAKTTDVMAKTGVYKWWEAKKDFDLHKQFLTTFSFLKDDQNQRHRQLALYARLYGNMSLFSFLGSSSYKMNDSANLPTDRPTFNLVQSCVDTLVSRISQSRPSPIFLTAAGDYKERNLAKKLNNFIQGEFYQTKAYDKAAMMLKDALITGTGVLKVYETDDHKVGLERILQTEIFVDKNEGMYGLPRQMYQVKLMDREVLLASAPRYKSMVNAAEAAFPDNSADASKTVADLVMVVEGWHLPSAKDANDGRHIIACSAGVLLDEEYTKDKFPFIFLQYSPRLLGFWGQGLTEQLMGTQIEINSLLFTISRAIKLVGVPRVFVEESSKVTTAMFTNDVGTIIKYRGIKPEYEVAPAVPQELYSQLQRLIDYGYQQSGVSAMQAGAQKPAGLNSGEAQRVYDDISTDRFNYLSRNYDNIFIDLTYIMTDLAREISERDGEYETIYPGKNGTECINLPEADLIKDPFIVQVFNQSSLPKDPAGRMQKITEMIQSGMISIKEGRRLLDYPDLDQVERLANASEERILKALDDIVTDGKYTPPDPFMDLQLANELSVQYYNLYVGNKLEEDRAQMLRDFHTQIGSLMQAAMPPAPPQAPGAAPNAPQANPEPAPTSPLIPNAPGAA